MTSSNGSYTPQETALAAEAKSRGSARLLDEALEGAEARVAQQALQVPVQDHLLGRARRRVVECHILRVHDQPLRVA